MADRIPMLHVEITRAEGPTRDAYWPAGITLLFKSWETAETALRKLCRSLDPKIPGYDKCDYEVCFEDGAVYSGRYDAAHPDSSSHSDPDLRTHMRRHLGLASLEWRPPQWSDERWNRWCAHMNELPQERCDASLMLQKYEIGQ